MTSAVTARYDLEAAPGGLALAQDLINTVGIGDKPDLLAEPGAWDVGVEIAETDLEVLRGFREDLRGLVSGEILGAGPGEGSAIRSGSGEGLRRWDGAAELELGEDGKVALLPGGGGARLVVSKVLAGIFEAQQLDTWRRLKTCRNPDCRAAFYDRSKNNSGVWHSLKTCGNPANLRAHRARNRPQPT